MRSLRVAIANARSRKKLPAFQDGSTRDLSRKLGLSPPVSVRDMLGTLDTLPPASVTFDSGPLTANFVHGSGSLFLQSDGATSFSGEAHESGVVGDNFFISATLLDVKDASGNALCFVHDDNLAGQLDIGKKDKSWNDIGGSSFISDNWEVIRASRVQYTLHASTDPFQVVETIAIALGIAVVIFVGVKSCSAQGGTWNCGWRLSGSSDPLIPGDSGHSPGAGFEYTCQCEFQ